MKHGNLSTAATDDKEERVTVRELIQKVLTGIIIHVSDKKAVQS